MWLSPDTHTQSSHTLLHYGAWVLITAGHPVDGWPTQFGLTTSPRLHHVPMETLDIPARGKDGLIEACGLASGGAVLIRPDGHVALRWQNDTHTLLPEVRERLQHLGVLNRQPSSLVMTPKG